MWREVLKVCLDSRLPGQKRLLSWMTSEFNRPLICITLQTSHMWKSTMTGSWRKCFLESFLAASSWEMLLVLRWLKRQTETLNRKRWKTFYTKPQNGKSTCGTSNGSKGTSGSTTSQTLTCMPLWALFWSLCSTCCSFGGSSRTKNNTIYQVTKSLTTTKCCYLSWELFSFFWRRACHFRTRLTTILW